MACSIARRFTTLLGALLALLLVMTSATAAHAETGYGMNWFFGKSSIAGYSLTKATIGNGGTLNLVAWMGHDAYYGNYLAPTIDLQRRLGGGSWQTIRHAKFDNYKVTATTPVYRTNAKTQTVTYRFISTPRYVDEQTRVLGSAYSKSLTVVYENQRRYTGSKQTYYGYLKAFCPATAIHLTGTSGNEAGHYSAGKLLITVSAEVAYMPRNYQRSVLLHECAHEHQFVNYGATAAGWDRMEVAMGKRFVNDLAPTNRLRQTSGTGEAYTFDPVEHAADCAAYAINPAGYLGYGGYCNAAELAAGKALLRGKSI